MKYRLLAVFTIVLSIFSFTFTIPAFAENVSIESKYAYVIASGLNLRSSWDTSSDILAVIPYGGKVDVINTSDNGWVNVSYDGACGWVDGTFLSTGKPSNEYDSNDLYWLAHIIMAEQEDEPWEDKIYTGSVVLNRAAWAHWFPDTIYDVIHQRNPLQYSSIVNGRMDIEPNEESWAAAKYLIENGSQIPANVLFQDNRPHGTGTWKFTGKTYYCYGD